MSGKGLNYSSKSEELNDSTAANMVAQTIYNNNNIAQQIYNNNNNIAQQIYNNNNNIAQQIYNNNYAQLGYNNNNNNIAQQIYSNNYAQLGYNNIVQQNLYNILPQDYTDVVQQSHSNIQHIYGVAPQRIHNTVPQGAYTVSQQLGYTNVAKQFVDVETRSENFYITPKGCYHYISTIKTDKIGQEFIVPSCFNLGWNTADEKHILLDRVMKQLEFYLSEENLSTDEFMKKLLNCQGWVQIKDIMPFRRLQGLTMDYNVILAAVMSSQKMELSEDKRMIRRKV